MIESIENLEDMKVCDDIGDELAHRGFSGLGRLCNVFTCSAGPHSEGVGVHGGTAAGNLQPLQELPAHTRG